MIKIRIGRYHLTSRNMLVLLWPLLVAVAKTARYTVLKNTLVSNAIGYRLLDIMGIDNLRFSIFDRTTVSDMISDTSVNAAIIYKKLNLLGLTTYAQFEVAITIIGNIILLLLFFSMKDEMDNLAFSFFAIMVVTVNTFDLCLSKEPIQMLFFLWCFFTINKFAERRKICIILLILIIFVMAVVFRTYYLAMLPYCYLALLVCDSFCKRGKPLLHMVIFVVVSVFIYAALLLFVRRFDYSIYSELLRVRVRYVVAVTRIVPWFDNSSLPGQMLNYLATVIRLLFPLELIRIGPKYYIYIIAQALISWYYIQCFRNLAKADNKKIFSIILFAGFLMMSAIHEIEFGSWIRHEASFIPAFILMNAAADQKHAAEHSVKNYEES